MQIMLMNIDEVGWQQKFNTSSFQNEWTTWGQAKGKWYVVPVNLLRDCEHGEWVFYM